MRQRGVALIMVLLVVAVVTVVSAGLVTRQQLTIRSSGNHQFQQQAWQYALGGEALAKALLERDLRETGAVDHPGEAWAAPFRAFELEGGGELRVRIEDLGGRLNVNGLVRNGRPDRRALERFQRLLRRLDIHEPYAERLFDWLDADEQASGLAGAEDNAYLLLQPAYRAANRPLADVSELRLLLNMSEAHYRRLLPHVSALPPDARLNVNSAGAVVLSSLGEALEPEGAIELVATRELAGYRSLEEFFSVLGEAGQRVSRQRLAVGSQYFQAICEVQWAGRRLVLVSQLQRGGDGRVRVLARDLGQAGLARTAAGERGDD